VRGGTAIVGAALAAALLSGCGGDDGPGPGATTSSIAPASVRTANGDSWNAATDAERGELVRGMREFFSGQVDSPGMVGKALPDGRATQLFDSYCAQSYAGAFSLYRLYGNAAAFTNPQK